MTQLQVSNTSVEFGATRIFQDVTFTQGGGDSSLSVYGLRNSFFARQCTAKDSPAFYGPVFRVDDASNYSMGVGCWKLHMNSGSFDAGVVQYQDSSPIKYTPRDGGY